MICTWPVPPSNFFFFPYWMQERRNGTHELFPDNYFIDLLLHICGASAQARCKHPSISRPDTFPPPESMGPVQSSFEIFAIESYSVEGRPECHSQAGQCEIGLRSRLQTNLVIEVLHHHRHHHHQIIVIVGMEWEDRKKGCVCTRCKERRDGRGSLGRTRKVPGQNKEPVKAWLYCCCCG
jgi:hypothetical protein